MPESGNRANATSPRCCLFIESPNVPHSNSNHQPTNYCLIISLPIRPNSIYFIAMCDTTPLHANCIVIRVCASSPQQILQVILYALSNRISCSRKEWNASAVALGARASRRIQLSHFKRHSGCGNSCTRPTQLTSRNPPVIAVATILPSLLLHGGGLGSMAANPCAALLTPPSAWWCLKKSTCSTPPSGPVNRLSSLIRCMQGRFTPKRIVDPVRFQSPAIHQCQ
jgi:hypothetical protein